MIVCIDCFKLFQTIFNKNKTCNGWAANQSLRIERDIMLRHLGEKNVLYILFERIIK